jgi:hypothetical protein
VGIDLFVSLHLLLCTKGVDVWRSFVVPLASLVLDFSYSLLTLNI